MDDKASIGKVLSMYLGKEYDFVYCEDPLKLSIGYTKVMNRLDHIRHTYAENDRSEFLHYLKVMSYLSTFPL